MLVKFTQAHHYRGDRTEHPVHPAVPRRTYMPGDIADIPVDYFEQHLEPYPFAHVHNPAAAAEGAAAALMEDMTIEQLRTLVDKYDLEDKIEASGPSGRATKPDLMAVLDKHYRTHGRTAADKEALPDDAALARMRVDALVMLCESRKIEVTGTGHDGKVLKADLVEALSELRELEDDVEAQKDDD